MRALCSLLLVTLSQLALAAGGPRPRSAVRGGMTHPRPAPERLRVAAVQPPLRPDGVRPLDAASRVLDMMRGALRTHGASAGGIDLFVLPELCPLGYSEHTFAHHLHDEEVLKGVDGAMAGFARDHGVFVCYGTVGRMRSDGGADGRGEGRRAIRQVVVDDGGEAAATYDKMCLCDYGDCAETRFFSPGGEACSFDCRGFRIGLIVCADMRSAELSRRLAADPGHGVDAILQPAAFARDISFRTWRSFRETRAVENGVYFVGVNYAGPNHGETSFNGPWIDEDHEPLVLGTEEGVLVSTFERAAIDEARREMPFHRRICEEWREANG